MAEYKVVNSTELDAKMESIADAIRSKDGTTGKIPDDDFADRIKAIETGENLPELNNPAPASAVLEGYDVIDENGELMAGAMPHQEVSNNYLYVGRDHITLPEGHYDGTTIWAHTTPKMSVTPNKEGFRVNHTRYGVYENGEYIGGADGFLSEVYVEPIPDIYQNVANVNAAPEDVLKGRVFVTMDGEAVGTLEVSEDGTIPDNYKDISGVTATENDVAQGKVFVNSSGAEVEGSLPIVEPEQILLYCGGADNSYEIPVGIHQGGSKVIAASNGLKEVTPSKYPIPVYGDEVTLEDGSTAYKYLEIVQVNPIPDKYQDVTKVTATADDVLSGKKIATPNGIIEGSMPVNADVQKYLNVSEPLYTIPKGHHNGKGFVAIKPEAKTITPTKEEQVIASPGSTVISRVTVKPIPDEYMLFEDVPTETARITPTYLSQTVTPTAGKLFESVEVEPIPDRLRAYTCKVKVSCLNGAAVNVFLTTVVEGGETRSTNGHIDSTTGEYEYVVLKGSSLTVLSALATGFPGWPTTTGQVYQMGSVHCPAHSDTVKMAAAFTVTGDGTITFE